MASPNMSKIKGHDRTPNNYFMEEDPTDSEKESKSKSLSSPNYKSKTQIVEEKDSFEEEDNS